MTICKSGMQAGIQPRNVTWCGSAIYGSRAHGNANQHQRDSRKKQQSNGYKNDLFHNSFPLITYSQPSQYEKFTWSEPWHLSEQLPCPGPIRVNCTWPRLLGATILMSKFTSIGADDACGSWHVEQAVFWSTICSRCLVKLRSASTLFCKS